RLAAPFPVVERAHDRPGDVHGADGVAECGRGRRRHVVVLLYTHRDARPQPVPELVVGTLVGVRSALALAGAAHVDDLRVRGPQIVDVDLEPRPYRRQFVGEEHVACGGELVEDVEAVV